MKKLLFLSFFGLFLLACTTDEGDGAPFVTDVVMPPSSQLFAPGDEVTVAARGFEADDDIMLRIAWPLSQAALPEGYADGVWAVVTERTESDITFLAPGGYPASTTEVKLFRRGKAMTLGKISVSDGPPPEEPSLYGITQYDCDETGIDRIDLTTGDLTRIETLGVLRRMHCVVNTPGSNRIYGLAPAEISALRRSTTSRCVISGIRATTMSSSRAPSPISPPSCAMRPAGSSSWS